MDLLLLLFTIDYDELRIMMIRCFWVVNVSNRDTSISIVEVFASLINTFSSVQDTLSKVESESQTPLMPCFVLKIVFAHERYINIKFNPP